MQLHQLSLINCLRSLLCYHVGRALNDYFLNFFVALPVDRERGLLCNPFHATPGYTTTGYSQNQRHLSGTVRPRADSIKEQQGMVPSSKTLHQEDHVACHLASSMACRRPRFQFFHIAPVTCLSSGYRGANERSQWKKYPTFSALPANSLSTR